MANIIPATGATVKLYDKLGLERTTGVISKDDKLEVTAADGVTTKVYYLSMLSSLPSIYHAYVLSNVYAVDQVNYAISGSIYTTTLVSEVLANLIPAEYATVNCIDQFGNIKATNVTLSFGDMIEVTSGDGNTTVRYSIAGITKASLANNKAQINLYPNPTSGNLYISGIEKGNRICVYNLLGQMVFEKDALQKNELISLNGQLKGVYFVKVIAKGKKDVIRKFILK